MGIHAHDRENAIAGSVSEMGTSFHKPGKRVALFSRTEAATEAVRSLLHSHYLQYLGMTRTDGAVARIHNNLCD